MAVFFKFLQKLFAAKRLSAFSDQDRGSALALLERPRVRKVSTAKVPAAPVKAAPTPVAPTPVAPPTVSKVAPTPAAQTQGGEEFEDFDRLLDNWQGDVLTKDDEEKAAKHIRQKPVTDAMLDRVLARDEQAPTLKLPTQKKPKPAPEVKSPVLSAKRLHTSSELLTDDLSDTKAPRNSEAFLKALRARLLDNERYSSTVKKRATALDQQVACQTCGTYIMVSELVEDSYCCPACATNYSVCNMCGNPFIVQNKAQKICSNNVCHLRYVRDPSLRHIRYVLVKE
ncbi:MAG: hypothetical protein ACRCVN_00520 [Spirochaetia bacterium]